jgi:hypothetical protein
MFLIKEDFWQIKKAGEKGLGVFAKKAIKAGTIIGDYLGKVYQTAKYDLEKDKKGLYLMYYTDRACIYPDLKNPGIHLINHSCTPNCWIYVYRGHTLFFALRKIKPGEELTISYLLSPKDGCNPCTHNCKCESRYCTGTMHLPKVKYEIWQKFQNTQKKKTQTAKVIFNKNLPKLPSYPKTIPYNPIYNRIINN